MTPLIEKKFAEFHEKNPHVYAAIVFTARALKKKGMTRFGIARVYEQIRYELEHTTANLGHYKLSNNYKSLYARKLVKEFPTEFEGVITMKELTQGVAA